MNVSKEQREYIANSKYEDIDKTAKILKLPKKTVKEIYLIELNIKIDDLMNKRLSEISEIKFLLHRFYRYFQNIAGLDKLGLLDAPSDTEFGVKVSGLSMNDMNAISERFQKILDYEAKIRELNTEKKNILSKKRK